MGESGWLAEALTAVAGSSPVMHGLVGGVAIAVLNAFGVLIVTVWRRPSERLLDVALGFGACVMLAASFTSLTTISL